ncbi:MAG: FG-GAP-like repeat-containing protein [Planctomycetales bacterium]|jgi:tetratricopeptide (TPR) repeat protein
MTESKKPRSRLLLGAIAFSVLVTGLALFFEFASSEHDEPNDFNESKSVRLARIAVLKNLGVAYLENNDLNEAEASFEELITLLPDERFGQQNLAITRLLKIAPENINRADDPAAFDVGFARARQTVELLLQKFPDDPKVHVIAARLALRTEDHASAVAALQNAAKLAPSDAAIWFGIYDAGRYSRNDKLTAEANKSLAKAWEFAPDNLYVMREWLSVRARAKDPKVEETFTAARKLVAPFVERISKFTNVDLHELIDQGLAALPKEEWNTVTRSAIVVGNMLRPEVATQNDAKKVTPHLLEFIVHDFSEDFYTNNTLPKPSFPEAIPVSFEPIETPFRTLKNVKQVHVVDFDLDQDQDVVIVQDDQLTVWTQDAGQDSNWTKSLSLILTESDLPSELTGICLFDLDRDFAVIEHATGSEKMLYVDADLDIVAYGKDGLVILRNEVVAEGENAGNRILVPVEQNEAFAAVKNVLTALPVDFDHDGDLDLVVSAVAGMSVWINRDDSTFVDHSQFSTLPPAGTQIHKLIAVDWDRNVSIDVLAFGEDQSGVLKNILHGQLRWEQFAEKSNVSFESAVALVDADSNFSWDLVTITGTTKSDISGLLTWFGTSNPDAGVTQFKHGSVFKGQKVSDFAPGDFDNDGFVDVATWNSTLDKKQIVFYRGGPDAGFEDTFTMDLKVESPILSCRTADVDSDGDIDLVVASEDSVEVLINEGGNANNWIDIPIRSDDLKQAQKPNERVNIHGIGSLLELRSGTMYQPQVVIGRTTHFGLGKQTQVDSARVLWTNGIPEHIVNPKHGQPICLQQDLKGSCPFLYTWDGEKFAFYTDCLWAAPIGLQLAEGVLAPPREWEYLKIDGGRLKAKDGEYVLKLTEELWEVGYFDSVKLLAIDHPADVDIYSNEKVGPPSISQFKVHMVQNPKTPIAAVDQQGRDVLLKIKARDEDFLQCFDRRFKQGLTEPHFLELDLGQLDDPQDITLFLTGWIRPTDTSLNVAISQRPDLESTQPPSVHVPNADGEWIKVQPYMGFPGGKTKTIAIDLSGIFPTDDYRVRIATTMEIYWDHAFFTVDDEPAEVRTTEMPLLSADLRYRGFSKKVPHTGLGPGSYDYNQLDTHQQWPPMEGRLTTYGDVTELVGQTDNRQALLGAGDEMEIRFKAASTKLPVGWKRDFILHNVGWDKDADLNTVFGQTVDPLPFAGMVGYPDPNGPAGQKPFAAQTRQQPRAKFWRAFSK